MNSSAHCSRPWRRVGPTRSAPSPRDTGRRPPPAPPPPHAPAARLAGRATAPAATPAAEPRAGVRVLPAPVATAPPSEPRVERVVLSVAAGKVVVVGDPTVTTVEAQGPVVATQQGNALQLDNRPIND